MVALYINLCYQGGDVHIPDGFLDAKTWGTLAAVSAVAIGVAAKKSVESADERTVPLMGVTAAFIFAAQMLNFPIAGGTSGHFLGGVLAAILLGPARGLLVMGLILIVQALLFADGGITALGANIFNMGVIGAVGGYFIFWTFKRLLPWISPWLSAAIAGWVSVVLAAAACAVELAISGTVPLEVVMPAMVGIHALIGIGEGAITAGALALVARVRPEVLRPVEVRG